MHILASTNYFRTENTIGLPLIIILTVLTDLVKSVSQSETSIQTCSLLLIKIVNILLPQSMVSLESEIFVMLPPSKMCNHVDETLKQTSSKSLRLQK